MKIKYVGPRPEISHRGVDFKVGKEDKYLYLPYAINILQALDKPDVKKHFIHLETFHNTTDDEIFNTIKQYEPEIDEHIQEEVNRFRKHLEDEIEEVNNKTYLSNEEKKVYILNLKIMRAYRIQRAVNKIAYIHTIEHVIRLIKKHRIEIVETPFCEKFWHIHESLRGHIFTLRSPVRNEFEIVEKDNRLFAQFKVLY